MTYNKAHAADCKKWHAIFAFAKDAPLFATADVRRYGDFRFMSYFQFLSIIFSLIATSAYAVDRTQNEQALLILLDVPHLADSSIKQYRSEAVRLYPSITEKNVDAKFSDVFNLGRKLIHQAYKDSLSSFTDKELEGLIQFYKTDFGKWYIEKFQEFNSKVLSNISDSTKKLNDAYVQRVYELESP